MHRVFLLHRNAARSILAYLAALTVLLSFCAYADETPTVASSLQRSKAVTQVVLGIFGYARWPQQPATLRLCLIGPTEYADDLIRGNVQNSAQPLQTRRLLAGDPSIPESCDAVYIGRLNTLQRQQLFRDISAHPILSISESDDSCTVGSMFCLNVTDEQVTFEVNLDSVARSGVRIHPSVLQLSKRHGSRS